MTRLEYLFLRNGHYLERSSNESTFPRLYLNFLVVRSEVLQQLGCQTLKCKVQIPSFAIKNEQSCSFFLILDTYSDTGSNLTGYILSYFKQNHWQPKSVERYPGKRLI